MIKKIPYLVISVLSLISLTSCNGSPKGDGGSAAPATGTTYTTTEKFVRNDLSLNLTISSTYSVKTAPSNGVLTNSGTNQKTYTPSGGFTGLDTAVLVATNSQKTYYFYVFDNPDSTNFTNDTYLNGSYREDPYYWWGLIDSKAHTAWGTETDCSTVRIGVIDTGIDFSHSELDGHKWTNAGETASNSTDDDGNGYIDDMNGWDFVNNDNDPDDDNGHGTHVAGIIGAEGGNSEALTGVCQNATLVAIKVIGSDGEGFLSDMIEGIAYANDNGVKITNNSYGFIPDGNGGGVSNWSDYLFSGDMKTFSDEMIDTKTAGYLFIASSGNSGIDNDAYLHLPSNYAKFSQTDHVIAVGSVAPHSSLSSFSNYGDETVNLVAPGESIVSPYPGGGVAWMDGTSLSAPFVTGTAGLLWTIQSAFTYDKIKTAITHADSVSDFTGKEKTISGGKLDIPKAITTLGTL